MSIEQDINRFFEQDLDRWISEWTRRRFTASPDDFSCVHVTADSVWVSPIPREVVFTSPRQVRWSEPADPTSWPDDLAMAAADAPPPSIEPVEERPEKSYEEWLADTTALLAEQERRHE